MSDHTTSRYDDGFNHDFTDEDVLMLLSIATSPEYRAHTCRWLERGGMPCEAVIQGLYFPIHLRDHHGLFMAGQNNARYQCLWEGCADGIQVSREILMRHIQERHLLWKWACPNCGTEFTRKSTRDLHHAHCVGVNLGGHAYDGF
ncbi:hypothetical protein HYDPIDRAFT_117160 [Hydnomerulius pinastri MD-312]|uniref:C2H2-type domain-containing protein n=1 Tax=Hydnomerulius pinastri MD-312 TaxID=994086 RepID=A0A0C9WAY0_9AGAM|nr:hypothetical protein HYDPIDRAFT_117160 [Hydnomerulius pinastri MD-312]